MGKTLEDKDAKTQEPNIIPRRKKQANKRQRHCDCYLPRLHIDLEPTLQTP